MKLGLVLAAVITLAATAVPAAPAQQGELTSNGEVTLDIVESGGAGANSLTLGKGESMECPGSTSTAHKAAATPHEPVTSGSTSFTITPSYVNCVIGMGESDFPSTVRMNGCDYVYEIGQTAAADAYAITVHMVCPEGKAIELEAFLGGGHGFRVCTFVLPPLEGLTGLQASNTAGRSHLGLVGALSGIHAIRSGLCGAGTTNEAKLAIDATVSATNGSGVGRPISISDEVREGQGLLRTHGNSVTLDAKELGEAGSGENALTVLGAKMECPGSTHTGHEVAATPHEPVASGSTSFTITPSYVNCVIGMGESDFPSTVRMNGCDYVYEIGQTAAADAYAITVHMVCPEGKAIELEAFLGGGHGFRVCTFVLPPLEGLTGLQASNTPAPSDVDLDGTLSGIHAQQSGICGSGSSQEAELSVAATLSGTSASGGDRPIAISDEVLEGQGLLTTDGERVTLDAEELGEAGSGTNALTAFGAKLECPGSTYTGHALGKTPHESVSNNATAATIKPINPNCAMRIGEDEFPTTVSMNGCDYVLRVGDTSLADVYAAQMDVACPAGSAIELKAYLNGSHEFEVCRQTIPPQQGLAGLTIANLAAGDPEKGEWGQDALRLAGGAEGIEMIQSGACGSAETEKGEFDLNLTVVGTNAAGGQTGIAISDEE